MSSKQDFWVVGVGASAGGLEALSAFFKNLPEKPAAAFIVAQHLAPHARSMMVELLSRQTSMPVMPVKDKQKIKPGSIFIVPPNFDVKVSEGELRLMKAGEETRPKPSVDLFFSSLASSHGRKAVGIILSGTGSDGSDGIRAIKEAGGVTIVQDAESAKYDGMPKSAFETGLIDAVLPPEKIASQLFAILDHKFTPPEHELNQEEEVDFKKILRYLKEQIGSDFSQYKISTIQRRIEKRLATLGIGTLQEYYKLLAGNPAELLALSQNMLVSVTSFFRDPEAYNALSHYIEEIVSRKPIGEEIRIWSAGCATGEEPYSLAMIVSDLCEKHRKPLTVKIFATDMDHEALSTARTGVYSSDEVSGVPKEFMGKYFEKRDKDYEVRKPIRDMIVFARQDLVQNPPFVKLDMVTCRNVLIYFEAPLQARIFEIFHYSLKAGGVLFLGKSESANSSLFESLDKKEKIFRRLNVLTSITPKPHSSRYSASHGHVIHPTAKKKPTELDVVAESAPVQLLKMLNISGVVVDEDGAIIHIMGDVSEYIQFPKGQADFRITNLLPKTISLEFNVLLKKAQKDGKLVKSRAFRVDPAVKKSFGFSIMPFEKNPVSKDLYIVAFEPKKTGGLETPEHLVAPESGERLVELEQELSATKENLQTLIEELEISNEELQSLNEELSSTNEELQASNEELETTNEELQSTNEELMTLNEELNIKSSELRLAYVNLDNIQTSIGAPVIVVDSELRLIRHNAASSAIFTFTPQDFHHPITRASCQCEIPGFESVLKETVRSGKIGEIVCQTPRNIYQLRVHPSRDENKKIVGAILIFFDNTEFFHTRDLMEVSEKRIRSIIDHSPTLITLKDNVGKYLSVNKAFLDFYQLKEDQVIGKTDRDLFPEKLANDIRDNDLEVLLKRQPSSRQDEIEFRNQKHFFHVNRFPLFGKNERNPYAIGSVSLDMTHEHRAQELLRISESRYRAMIEEQSVFVVRHLPNGRLNFTNTSFQHYFNIGPDDSLKLNFPEFVHGEHQGLLKAELDKISYTHPITQYEVKIAAKAGTPARWVRWIHRGIFDEKGRLHEYQAVGLDITDIHNQTADLLAKESLYTHVLEHTSDYLSVYRLVDGEFYLENFNQSASHGHGNLQKFIGKRLSELLGKAAFPEMNRRYHKSLETKEIMNFEESVEGPGGTVFLSTTIVPIDGTANHPPRIVALSRDITKLKRTERALREEMKNAEAANRAKSEFLASMSHELRTPLNVIMGMGQLLVRGELADNQKKLVESIQRSSKVLLTLIEDVLDLSKIEAGKIAFELRPVSLDQLTNDAVHGLETEAQRKGLELTRDFRIDNNLVVMADPVRLKQVLGNLLSNALKFTEKGSVKVTARLEGLSDEIVSVYFEVKDTGIGIPEESFPKLFKRFSQADSSTSRKFGGTGLGLAISKQLVELMNGQIGFESKEGVGSTFWFKVQFSRAHQNIKGEYGSEGPPLDFTAFKILAVDDNPESLRFLKLFFDDHGGKLTTAGSGVEALSLVEKDTFDLILMDMQMPEMDGLETTRRVRSLTNIKKRTPVIALTANAMPGDKEMCLKAGMNDYLTKPVDLDELTKLLRKWL